MDDQISRSNQLSCLIFQKKIIIHLQRKNILRIVGTGATFGAITTNTFKVLIQVAMEAKRR